MKTLTIWLLSTFCVLFLVSAMLPSGDAASRMNADFILMLLVGGFFFGFPVVTYLKRRAK